MYALFNRLSFTKKYLFALSLIALFSILAFFNLTHLISSQSHDGEVINISGRQRMLSQKIALFAIHYKTKQLSDTIDLMEESHNYLMAREMSEQLQKVYFSKPTELDKYVTTYLFHAKAFVENRNGRSLTYLLVNSQTLLKDLDRAVSLYQSESESKIDRLQEIELYIVLLTLATLIFEALFIFRPANRSMQKKTQALIKEKNYLNMVTESNTNAIIAVGADFKVETYNQSAEAIFGYSKEEMLGKDSLHSIIPEIYLEMHNLSLADFVKTGVLKHKNKIFELEAKRKNGEHFPIRISFGAHSDTQSKVVVANIQDVTDEKKKDRILQEQSRFAAMGEMIGNIAHQWRQPLSTIRTIASGTRMRRKANLISDDELDESFVKISKQTEHLSHTIDDFRNFFKKGQIEAIFPIETVVQHSIALTDAMFKDYAVALKTDFISMPLQIRGSESELSQVFMNIFKNAKDIFLENKSEKRVVSVEIKKEHENAVVIVSDSAGGIPEAILPNIFDPYFTTKHQSHGTGIGLYMSKEIVEKHFNGRLTVSNATFMFDGQKQYGACFSVKIPSITT